MKISASIVLYRQPIEEISKTVNHVLSFSDSDFCLILVDNSPDATLSALQNISDKIKYIPNPSNPGFGAAHNIAFKMAKQMKSQFHFVINPDVELYEDVMTPMIGYMYEHPEVGMMMPQILNQDGTVQNLPKLLPSPYSIIMRKLKKPAFIYKNFINTYELRTIDKDKIYNAPVLSGCFSLFRMSAIDEIGLYDDRFFMYFEDWDMSRRMHAKYKTIYYPKVSVIHGYESGANKNSRLFKIFLQSAKHYFNKWGWISDQERNKFNKEALLQFKQ